MNRKKITACLIAAMGVLTVSSSVGQCAELSIDDAVAKKHSHANAAQLDKVGEADGVMTYGGAKMATQAYAQSMIQVAATEAELKEQGVEYTVHKNFFRANGKALSIDETEGMLKLIADKDDKIISCHIFGPHSADIVQEVTALMNSDCTVSKLKDIIHIHPTLGEILI